MPIVRCAPFSRTRRLVPAAATLLVLALLPSACSDNQPTEPPPDRIMQPNVVDSCTDPCYRDNFTDADGTLLQSHVPDGGTSPFSWRKINTHARVAEIRDNAMTVAPDPQFPQSGGFVTYAADGVTADAVEIEVEVFAEVSFTQHDVGILLRNQDNSGWNGYTIFWSIGGFGDDGRGSIVTIDAPGENLAYVDYSSGPIPVGIHTMRAEVLEGGVINVYIDGALAATATDTSPLPPGWVGLNFGFTARPSSLRITSFSAGAVVPPLTCTPSVERGREVTCVLSSSTSGDVTGWEFTPAAGTSSLPPVQDTSTSREWKGIAAVGGVARVQVTDGSTQRTFEASFTVTDRPSLWSSMWSYRQGPEPLVPDVDPHGGVLLGRNCPEILLCVPTLRVQPDPTTPGAGYTAAAIGSGPNKGYWHVAAQMWNMKRVANVNPAMLPGSPRTHPLPKKTPKQCRQALGFAPNATAFANFFQYNDKCQSINMTAFVDGVWGHEGFGYNGGQGHESLARTAAAEPQNDPYTAIESLVYPDSATLESVVRSKVVPIANDITQRSADPNPSGNRAPGPIWFWDAGPATYNLYHIAGF